MKAISTAFAWAGAWVATTATVWAGAVPVPPPSVDNDNGNQGLILLALIGVVSGGVKCGTTGVPSRYTRIGHPLVQAWLASHVPGFRSGQTAR